MSIKKVLTYKPAVLKKRSWRWFLQYSYRDRDTGKWILKRETFNLNSIKDLKVREEMFLKVQRKLNIRLENGYPYEEKKKKKKKRIKTTLADGINYALKIKLSSLRLDSHRTYKSKAKIFLEWAKLHDLGGMNIRKFSRENAQQFLNHILLNRKVSPIAYNNYLQFIKSYFQELLNENYIKKNPFDGISRKKPGDKKRRAFSMSEKKIVANYCKQNYPMLFLGIILQYYCFIRPAELRRLRVGDIDIKAGVITLMGSQTKNKKQEIVTIPDVAANFLKNSKALKSPDHFLIFGVGIRPNETKPCGERSLNYKQRHQVLLPLQKAGLLKDITGLSFYSWKDTGAYALVKAKVNIIEIMKQLRHTSLEVTQRYCNSLYSLNKEIKGLDNPLI